MAELTLIDPPAEVAVGARRAEVLARLREAEGPLSVQQVASQTGLHVSVMPPRTPAVIPSSMANLRQASITGQPLQLTCAGASQS